MKIGILGMAVMMVLAFNAKGADVDSQINASQDFVVVGTPLYQGYRFLARTAEESADGTDHIAERAAEVCRLMKLGQPMAYSATLSDYDSWYPYWREAMWTVIDQNLNLASYVRGTWIEHWWPRPSTFGRLSYIDNLSCKR